MNGVEVRQCLRNKDYDQMPIPYNGQCPGAANYEGLDPDFCRADLWEVWSQVRKKNEGFQLAATGTLLKLAVRLGN